MIAADDTCSILKLSNTLSGCCPFSSEGRRVRSDRIRRNGSKLKESRFDIRKNFFTMRVVRSWHRLPREAVAAPSLAAFKARLAGALSNLVRWKVSLPMAGGLELGDL